MSEWVMIRIKKDKDGAVMSFGAKRLSYFWNEDSQDDFKKMLEDIRDMLGVPCMISITPESLLEDDTWKD